MKILHYPRRQPPHLPANLPVFRIAYAVFPNPTDWLSRPARFYQQGRYQPIIRVWAMARAFTDVTLSGSDQRGGRLPGAGPRLLNKSPAGIRNATRSTPVPA